MAAVTPHLEQQDDPSETVSERKYFDEGTFEQKLEEGIPTGLDGLGRSEAQVLSPEALKSLQASHSELLRLAYAREVTFQQLKDRSFTAVPEKGEIVLRLDKPISGAPWNAAGAGDIKNVRLLSWTQKMGTPSFSISAGPANIGGACPGALGGQSVVPVEALLKGQHRVTHVTGLPVSIADAVCEKCYATGGNYQYGSNVLAQAVRHRWAIEAVRDGSFTEVMTWAVDNASYLLDGGSTGTGKKKVDYAPERFKGRFFRIHDSGDFFSPGYLRAWKAVADKFKTGPNRTTFWAPSRVWATPWGIDVVNEVNGDKDSNLIIRPSIYHVNEEPPKFDLGPGWSGWSVVYSQHVKEREVKFPSRSQTAGAGRTGTDAPFDWDCQAYAVVDEAHSCRNARGPKKTGGGSEKDLGCRACWLEPEMSVNYTEH